MGNHSNEPIERKLSHFSRRYHNTVAQIFTCLMITDVLKVYIKSAKKAIPSYLQTNNSKKFVPKRDIPIYKASLDQKSLFIGR